jgi:hypothetical protein
VGTHTHTHYTLWCLPLPVYMRGWCHRISLLPNAGPTGHVSPPLFSPFSFIFFFLFIFNCCCLLLVVTWLNHAEDNIVLESHTHTHWRLSTLN